MATKDQEIIESVKYLYNIHFDNEKHVENLHEMFLSFAKDAEPQDDIKHSIIGTYEAMRNFLRETNQLLNPKTC